MKTFEAFVVVLSVFSYTALCILVKTVINRKSLCSAALWPFPSFYGLICPNCDGIFQSSMVYTRANSMCHRVSDFMANFLEYSQQLQYMIRLHRSPYINLMKGFWAMIESHQCKKSSINMKLRLVSETTYVKYCLLRFASIISSYFFLQE